MAILIDASVLCAYANTSDIHYQKAIKTIEEAIEEKYGAIVITDYIFDEIVSVVNRKTSREKAIKIGKYLFDSEILLARVDHFIFEKAWELFQNTKELSFTDCTSIAFMQIFGIKKIATFDKGFNKIKDIQVIN